MPALPRMTMGVGVIGWLLLGTPADTQTTQSPPAQIPAPPRAPAPARDTSAQPQKGTAVIRGRVLAGDNGRGLRRARISVSSSELGPGSSRTASTDLSGRYEIKDLPAARYVVRVTRSGYLPLDYGQRRPGEQGRPVQLADGQVMEKIDFALPRMSVITGQVTDETGEPMEGVTVLAMRPLFFEGTRKFVPIATATTDDEGEYRLQRLSPATYVVMASTKETWTVLDKGKETVFGYAPTYFPGLTTPSEARRVPVGLGQRVPAIGLSLVPGRAATISGTAFDSQHRPFPRVSLGDHIRGINFASFRGAGNATVAADGTFTIPNVPPGEYKLNATRLPGDPTGGPEFAELTIVVDGTDLENVALVGSVGGTVSGRVVVEGAGAPKWSSIRVDVRQPLRNQQSPGILGAFTSSGSGPVKDDGTFVVPHVFPQARFQMTLPDGWMLKSVMHAGKDIGEAELQIGSGEEIRDVEITITDRVTTLSGQLTDDKNQPVNDATVVVFAADAARWFESSRAVKAARPDQQGQWRVRALPPGEYLAIALEYVEDASWNDPEYLESLRRFASSVTLGDGGSRTIALKVVTPKG